MEEFEKMTKALPEATQYKTYPQPSAPSLDDLETPNTSGYNNATPPTLKNINQRSSRRIVVDDEEEEFEVIRRRQMSSSANISQSVSGSDWFMGAVGLAAIGMGVYYGVKAWALAGKPETSYAETSSECVAILKEMKRDIEEYQVVGLDCQWTPKHNEIRSVVALLQIATHKGNILLVPLKKYSDIPVELRDMLKDRSIIKTGIEVLEDAIYLNEDYGLIVNGTYDLRYLANDCGIHHPEGLEKLSKKVLDLDIGRDWEIINSDWDAQALESKQKVYAETAVKASIDLFTTMIPFVIANPSNSKIKQYCRPKLDERFVYNSRHSDD